VVTLAGRDVYLGEFGSDRSKAEYRRRLGEYMASGGMSHMVANKSALTIVELVAAYWEYIC